MADMAAPYFRLYYKYNLYAQQTWEVGGKINLKIENAARLCYEFIYF